MLLIASCGEQRWAKQPVVIVLFAKKGNVIMYFPNVFIGKIKDLAMQIAVHQRGEHKLQDISTLIMKFEREHQEFLDAQTEDEELGEIADLVYYACQLAFQGKKEYLGQVQDIARLYNLDEYQTRNITLAKYRLRSAGTNSKDFQRERDAIREALR